MSQRTHSLAAPLLLLLASCVGSIGDHDHASAPPPGVDSTSPVPQGEPNLARIDLRRLTRREVADTIADLTGVQPDADLIRGLPNDSSSPFDNDASVQSASAKLIAAANSLAEDVAAKLVADPKLRDALVGCTPTGADDTACFQDFVAHFGRRAFRRTLSGPEVGAYATVLMPFAAEADDFYAAVERMVAAALQDVEFLYRIEIGKPIADRPGWADLDDFEIASRMAFLLWGVGPDDALLDRAEQGALTDSPGRAHAAGVMLADPRARKQVERFYAMWLGYETSLPESTALSPSLQAKLRLESDALVERVVFDDRESYAKLFSADETFIDDELAEHYGDLEAPKSATPQWVSYGDSQRRGILSHGSFLNVGNKFVDTSPTQRGKLIRERLLCSPIPPPPKNLKVNTDQPPAGKCKSSAYDMSKRDECKGCHAQMDPIGFGLERYDLGGAYRTEEPAGPDCPISGDGAFVNGTSSTPFSGPGELAALLVGPRLDACVAQQVFAFTEGRETDSDDGESLAVLAGALGEDGRFDDFLLGIIGAASFGMRQVP